MQLPQHWTYVIITNVALLSMLTTCQDIPNILLEVPQECKLVSVNKYFNSHPQYNITFEYRVTKSYT